MNVLDGYKCPIDVIRQESETQFESEILSVIQKYGISVNKNELVAALNYDRNQYSAGYGNGYSTAMNDLVYKLSYYKDTTGTVKIPMDKIVEIVSDFCVRRG